MSTGLTFVTEAKAIGLVYKRAIENITIPTYLNLADANPILIKEVFQTIKNEFIIKDCKGDGKSDILHHKNHIKLYERNRKYGQTGGGFYYSNGNYVPPGG